MGVLVWGTGHGKEQAARLREKGSAGVGIPPPSEHASLGDQWDAGMREAGWD